MNSRELALEILLDIEKNKGYSNITINKYLKKYNLIKDENFIRQIVYGVIENKAYIDYIIRKKSSIRLKKIHETVLMILRMGTYQLCFLDNIPDSAAVNEAVKLVKDKNLIKSTGFVNGILRNISREKEELMKINSSSDIEYLSIRYSHPAWLVEKWIEDYGYQFTKEILVSNNTQPKLNIRTNILKNTREELISKLEDKGFDIEKTKYSAQGIIILNPKRITELEEFKKGYFTIQDESSMLVSEAMNPKENSLVLDISSAPGGKTTHIGELMNNKGKIIARDIYKHRTKLIEDNAKRLDINIIETEIYDGLKLDENLIDKLDYCLLDAPCSALGNIRRSPEIKWNKSLDDIKDIVKLQKELLNVASKYIKIGGVLIYSTCTINKEENIEQISNFLKKNKNFLLEKIELDGIDENIFPTKTKGYLEIYPNIHNMDGFFIAKLKRIN